MSRSEQLATLLVILGCVTVWTLYSFLHPTIDSTDRNVVGAAILKDLDPTALPRDTLFAHPEIYGYYTPAYRFIVGWAWQQTGQFEQAYLILLPLVMGGYLLSMVALLWFVTRNVPMTLGLTVAAAHYHNVMGASGWGVGSAASLGARVFFMPAAPVLFLLLLRLAARPTWPQAALLGLGLGLATNLHPISGFHFLMVASLFLLITQRQRAFWPLGLIGLTTALTASPFIWHFSQHRAPSDAVDFARFSQIVTELYSLPFSPETFPFFTWSLTRPTLDYLVGLYLLLLLPLPFTLRRWPRHTWLMAGLVSLAYAYLITLFENPALILLAASYLVWQFTQGDFTPLDRQLIGFVGLMVLYSFVGYYGFTFLWHHFALAGITSFLTEFARAAALVYLPLYALAGLGGVMLLRLHWPDRFVALFLALAPSLMTAWSQEGLGYFLGASFLLGLCGWGGGQLTRRWPPFQFIFIGLSLLLLFLPFEAGRYLPLPALNPLQPTPLYSPVEAELYAWTETHTPKESLFYGCFGPVTLTQFRLRTQRSLTHNWKDLTFYLHSRGGLIAAYDRFRAHEAACQDPASLIAAAQLAQADYLLVARENLTPQLPPPCFYNDKYAVFSLKGCP